MREICNRSVNAGTCKIASCENKAFSRQWCKPHYYRWYTYGDPMWTPPTREKPLGPLHNKPRPPHKDRKGYLKMSGWKDHPVAHEGRIYIHQLVLFDKIGYGPHTCHWCGTHINWKRGLETDHVDDDKLNNDESNLVQSCKSCNSRRGQEKSERLRITPSRAW